MNGAGLLGCDDQVSDDHDEPVDVKRKKKKPVSEDLKQKFDALKAKRLEIAAKSERKRRLKSKVSSAAEKKPDESEDRVANNVFQANLVETSSGQSDQKCLDKFTNLVKETPKMSDLSDDRVRCHFEEEGDREKIRSRIDLAIDKGHYELAEKLSDSLVELEQRELALAKDQAEKLRRKLESSGRKRKKKTPLPWRFEAKKFWESKSNL